MSPRDLLSDYADAKPTSRYYLGFAIFCFGFVFDFFDFFIVGFLLAVLGPTWHLTYGQSSLILLGAGIGAIFGSLFSGALADAFGRKKILMLAMFICAIGAGGVAFLPEGAWAWFAVMRFLVGVGLSGSATVTTVMMVELTPTAYRTRLAGLPFIAASVGSLIASVSAATLIHALGWRGVAIFGFAPFLLAVAVGLFVPESPLWLLSRGRQSEAKKALLRIGQFNDTSLPVSVAPPPKRQPSGKLTELLAYPGRTLVVFLTWTALSTANFGVYLWGPTVVALLLHIAPAKAAQYFIAVAIAAVLGRILLSILPVFIGRRRTCALSGFCIAIALAGAALGAQDFVFGYPVFVIMITFGAFFFDGAWVALCPYVAEIYPTRLAGRAIGIGQAGNGVGKILGPLSLAIIAGAGQIVTPKATSSAIMPSFMFLALCGLFMGLAFVFLSPEEGASSLRDEPETASRDKVTFQAR